MTQIVLTIEEQDLIERHLNGKYSPFFAPKEEQEMFNAIMEKAEALEEELNAYDETAETDLLAWYYGKFKEQEES